MHIILVGFWKWPFMEPLLLVLQCRILMIAVMSKLRSLQRRRKNALQLAALPGNGAVVAERNSHSAPTVRRIVWSSLLGSMTMVVAGALGNLPSIVVQLAGINSHDTPPALVQFKNYIHVVAYLYSPFVYLTFFLEFRATAQRVFGLNYIARRWPGLCRNTRSRPPTHPIR